MPLLFAFGLNRFSHDVAHVCSGSTVCLVPIYGMPGTYGLTIKAVLWLSPPGVII